MPTNQYYNPYPIQAYGQPNQNQIRPNSYLTPYPTTGTYYPQYFQAPQQQMLQPQSDIHWVQGESGAKAYVLEPGKSALLMDSETNQFYIKMTDASGMPLPLRVFRYTEEETHTEQDTRKSATPDMSQYLTKDDFGKMLEEYLGPIKKEGGNK